MDIPTVDMNANSVPTANPLPRWLLLPGCILVSFLPVLVAWVFTDRGTTRAWYALIEKPPISPPGWVFGPVWTLLHTLMGVSLYLVIQHARRKPGFRVGLVVFVVQLPLNAAWTPVYFGMQSIGGGLLVILLPLPAIVFMALAFSCLYRTAGLLQIPYALWVCFATVLNAWLYVLNP